VSAVADFYDRPALIVELRRDEGERPLMFVDSTGHATVGVGHNLNAQPISKRAIATILDDDIDAVIAGMDLALPWWRRLDPVRARVLLNMAFNLGVNGLLGFVLFLRAMEAADWPEAVAQMEASRWRHQVGARATRLQAMVLPPSV
jgi:lysozyme